MASLAQNITENPWHVPWNNNDDNTEFEEGQENMMGFSCVKAVYEYISYLHSSKKISLPHKKNSNPEKEVL